VLAESYILYSLVYDSLYELDAAGAVVPGLVAAAEASADGLEWRLRLRSDGRFHDGAAVTARDVAFSLQLYRDHPEFPFLHGYTAAFQEIEALAPDLVRLRLERPLSDLAAQLVYLFVLPEHLWKAHAGAGAVEFENEAMVGSGPFRLVEYRAGETVRLAANRAHPWAAPRIDEAVFVTFGSLDALVQSLRTGQVDLITEMPAAAAAALERAPGVAVARGTPLAPRVADVLINQLPPARCPPGGACSGHPALRDVAVRRALSLATDRRELIDIVLFGAGRAGVTLLPDGLREWFHPGLAAPPFDLEAARAELEAAGYRDRDGDGVREGSDGRALRFRFYRPSDSPWAPRAAERLRATWAEVGVRVEPRAVDPSALVALRTPAFDYDLILWSWESDPDPNLLLGAMVSSGIADGSNESGYSNPNYDALFAAQAATVDRAARRALVFELQEIVWRDAVYVIPFYPLAVQAFGTDRFEGWRTDTGRLALEDRASLTVLRRR
jgi:peptide/nickel transport system substrate-binding protein